MEFDVLLIAGVIVTILLNLLIVVVILGKGKYAHYLDLIIVSLSISDILQAGVGYMIEMVTFPLLRTSLSTVRPPLAISTATAPAMASITEKQKTFESECKAAGFFVTFLALTSIFHLTGISIERRFVLLHPLRARMWMRRKIYAMYVVLPSWFCGLFWASLPLLGWNSYIVRSGKVHRCSVNISGRDANHLTYSYNLLFWCFVVPLIVMGYCCNDIRITLKRQQLERVGMGIAGEILFKRRKMERRVTLMTIAMITTFLLAWTPYAICLLVITAEVQVSLDLFASAAIFAKLSTLYNPIIYLIFTKDFRTRLKKMLWLQSRNTVAPQRQTQNITLDESEMGE